MTASTHVPRTPEPADISGRSIAFWMVALAVFVGMAAVTIAGVQSSMQGWAARQRATENSPSPHLRPNEVLRTTAPVLSERSRIGELSPLDQLRHSHQQRLATYGWIDRTRGIAHIPIDRAIELRLQSVPREQAAETSP